MRRFYLVATSAIVLVSAFLMTLWIIDTISIPSPLDNRPEDERLASQTVPNASELRAAASASGLRLSRRMKGNIDAITRVNPRDVTVTGWLADPEGDETPLNLLVFMGGPMVATAKTKGERPDVSTAIGLAFGAEKNVSFQMSFICNSGDQPIVVGIGKDKQYVPLQSPKCP